MEEAEREKVNKEIRKHRKGRKETQEIVEEK